jgi:DNA-binding MarR family transcriptional regulator
MTPISSERAREIRSRQQAVSAIRESLRELRIQLALLNYRVGSELDLKDIELDCMDILDTKGALSPTDLARRAGVHPATMTGILDRLERGGWIVRERDPGDRRAVRVRLLPDRYAELLRLYASMSKSMNKILAGYSDSELKAIADFLHRTAEAGGEATEQLTRG